MTRRATTEEVSLALDRAGLGTAIQPEDAQFTMGLLRWLALGRPVTLDEARSLGAQFPNGDALVATALQQSERDDDGSIIGLLGLSLADHPHRIHLGERRFTAWCAWDTLFLPPILGETAMITSRDPESGRAISVTVSPKGIDDASPEGILLSVIAPDLRNCADAASVQAMFCAFVHFFSDAEAAERWFRERNALAYLLTPEEGFELGRLRLAGLYAYTGA